MGETCEAGTHAGNSTAQGSRVGIVFSTARELWDALDHFMSPVTTEVSPPEFSAQQILQDSVKVLEFKLGPESDLLGGRVPKLWKSSLAGSTLELSKVTVPGIL